LKKSGKTMNLSAFLRDFQFYLKNGGHQNKMPLTIFYYLIFHMYAEEL